MRNAAAKLAFIILTFSVTLISRMVISKEDALFKTRPKPKVNAQLHWISLFSKYRWIKITGSGLFYEVGYTGILLIKMDIAHFKLKLTEDDSQCQKECLGY